MFGRKKLRKTIQTSCEQVPIKDKLKFYHFKMQKNTTIFDT